MATVKIIYFATNFNNKLACSCMIHIDKAPEQPVRESVMMDTVIEIHTEDNSFPATRWVVVDLLRIPLKQVASYLSWPSHGVDFFEFAKYFMHLYQTIDHDFPVAVYSYKKVGG